VPRYDVPNAAPEPLRLGGTPVLVVSRGWVRLPDDLLASTKQRGEAERPLG
jgi:hypothetical protein